MQMPLARHRLNSVRRMVKIAQKSCLLLIVLLAAGERVAQQSPSPGDVNNCTLLTDPTRLRLCIEAQQGVTAQPGGQIVTPGPAGSDPYRRLNDGKGSPTRRNQPP
jgi:hypothetical protein